jgi:DME family drug/metabolite transporter
LLIGALGLLALARFRVAKPSVALFVAAAGMAGYQLAFFSGVARAGVAAGTVVAIGSAPLLAGLGAWVFRGERLSRWWWMATGIAVTGLILLAAPGRVDEPFGLLMAFLAGACYSAYAVASKDLLAKNDPLQVLAGVFTVAAITLAAVTRLDGSDWVAEGWPVALWLGLAATTFAYALFAGGLRQLPVRTAATLSLAEPVTASVLAVVILGERPTAWAWFGIALVVLGLTFVARELGVRGHIETD